ncbi:Glyoxylase, beta-lactamase superfamily II [Nocardiopsis flavescens]|uniref:Glyoxylase, beta-lactamase superfamily II n=1 Tax=Nocardiopsis flavescens TaxID=758803 RepID=A0A1M6FNI4_9ACTN|nr:MBL fold metallo-hydrolase [Nocardiopsis flavescens]SHI99234.1 Glyoxylase, beta-lactamase superfamily II [Nocardiopsis flavescens]
MFWKRKPKTQDGQEATDSAAEAVVDDTGATEETARAEATSGEKAATADKKADAEKAGEPEGAGASADSDDAAGEKAAPAAADDDESAAEAVSDDAGSEGAPDAGDTDATETTDGADSEKTDSAKADAEDTDSEKAEDEDTGDEAPASSDVFADDTEEAGVTGPDSEGVTRVRAAVSFEFDDEKFEYIGNTWIVRADDDGVVVIDPGPDAEAVLEAVGEREVYLVACTNAYAPHIESAVKIAEETEAPVALHPREMRLWRRQHGAEHRPDYEIEGGGSMTIGDLQIDVVALPGTSPGTVGYSISQLGVVFSGDTLRKGEPGMVGNTYIDYTTQLASIGESLLSLPPDTRILPDRGPATTVAAEGRNFDSWV